MRIQQTSKSGSSKLYKFLDMDKQTMGFILYDSLKTKISTRTTTTTILHKAVLESFTH